MTVNHIKLLKLHQLTRRTKVAKKKYRVYFAYEKWIYADVEAESETDAREKILHGDYDNEVEYGGGTGEIDEVEELKEEN